MILPIRTESEIRRTPRVNLMLIGINLAVFILLSGAISGGRSSSGRHGSFAFHSELPAFYQFFTYQFLHADFGHLVGNLIFLCVFGNSVNSKLGDLPYLLFYLAGGVFAAWGYAFVNPAPFQLIGASGAIAAVTTAYLALYPRSRVTVLIWFFVFLHFVEVPAMILIGLKIIVWDNLVAPRFGGIDHVAYGAHLAGYLYGFVAGLLFLFLRAVPRDQFDILALWKRWYRRQEFAAAMRSPQAAARAQFGTVARVDRPDPRQRALEEALLDRIADLRARITQAVEQRRAWEAAELYGELARLDPRQCLSERDQLTVGREFYAAGRFAEAAAAFNRFVECYPASSETPNVRLLLGIMYARDLRELELADRFLTQCLPGLRDTGRRSQCFEWLRQVRAALGRPAPEA